MPEHRFASCRAAVEVAEDPDRSVVTDLGDEIAERSKHRTDVEQPGIEHGGIISEIARYQGPVGLSDDEGLVRMIERHDRVSMRCKIGGQAAVERDGVPKPPARQREPPAAELRSRR